MSAIVGSQYGATTVAVESLIAQLDSQGKLTTLRSENQKIRHRNRNFQSKRTRFVCVGTSDLSIDTKTYMCKSRATIYLIRIKFSWKILKNPHFPYQIYVLYMYPFVELSKKLCTNLETTVINEKIFFCAKEV
jgi:hypothetical protein